MPPFATARETSTIRSSPEPSFLAPQNFQTSRVARHQGVIFRDQMDTLFSGPTCVLFFLCGLAEEQNRNPKLTNHIIWRRQSVVLSTLLRDWKEKVLKYGTVAPYANSWFFCLTTLIEDRIRSYCMTTEGSLTFLCTNSCNKLEVK